jgi:hypothetical protein
MPVATQGRTDCQDIEEEVRRLNAIRPGGQLLSGESEMERENAGEARSRAVRVQMERVWSAMCTVLQQESTIAPPQHNVSPVMERDNALTEQVDTHSAPPHLPIANTVFGPTPVVAPPPQAPSRARPEDEIELVDVRTSPGKLGSADKEVYARPVRGNTGQVSASDIPPQLTKSSASAPIRGVELKWQTVRASPLNRHTIRGMHTRVTRTSGIPTTGGRFAPLYSEAEDDGLAEDVTPRAVSEGSDLPPRETFRAHRRVGRAESRHVRAVGKQTRQGEQSGENGVTQGEKGSARGRAARPRTLGDFLPWGGFVDHRQRDPVDQPGMERRVSPPSHGPVLTEASLGPLPVEEVGFAGRVPDRAMRHFRQKRRRARRRSRAWRDNVFPTLAQPIGVLASFAGNETASSSKSSPAPNSGDDHVKSLVERKQVLVDDQLDSGAVLMRGLIGGTMHTAMITAQDWIDAPFQGWAGLRWLLARKLAREFERAGTRKAPMGSSEDVDGDGKRLRSASWPADLEQLAEQSRRGYVRRPGGTSARWHGWRGVSRPAAIVRPGLRLVCS